MGKVAWQAESGKGCASQHGRQDSGIPVHKIIPKWIEDLDIKDKSFKLLEENIRETP